MDKSEIIIVVAHPTMDNSRVNILWKKAAQDSGFFILDIGSEMKDWQIDIKKHQEILKPYKRIVLQFPLYWYSCPAIMKKWLDDILTYGWAYGPDGKALFGKELIIATSCGGPEESYRAGSYNSFSVTEFLKPFQQLANCTGMKFLPFFVLYGAKSNADELINKSCQDYITHISSDRPGLMQC